MRSYSSHNILHVLFFFSDVSSVVTESLTDEGEQEDTAEQEETAEPKEQEETVEQKEEVLAAKG